MSESHPSILEGAPVIAVDCMGGDFGPKVTLAACKNFLNNNPDGHLILVGLADSLAGFSHPRARLVTATEVVTMDDAVEVAMRRKKDSSMRVAIKQVKEGAAQAAVSAGNTGALMAISYLILRTIEGIDRPAIAGQIPNVKGRATTVLDMGANVDSTAEHLLQFAVMGSALVSVLDGNDNPSVGLLNIGEEEIKGNEATKKAGKLLRAAGASGELNFFGNVEGNDIFKGTVDIVVCDGFVGNVALKTSEGLASMIGEFLRKEFSRTIFTKLAGAISYPVLAALKRRVDHRRYNGGALLGLRGLVFKSHGSADVLAFEIALKRAHDSVKNNLLLRVQSRIAHAAATLAQDFPLSKPASEPTSEHSADQSLAS